MAQVPRIFYTAGHTDFCPELVPEHMLGMLLFKAGRVFKKLNDC